MLRYRYVDKLSTRLTPSGVLWDPIVDGYVIGLPNGPNDVAIQGYDLDYALHPRTHHRANKLRRGVDHESYAFQLALDMGAAPTATYMLRVHGLKAFYTWAMGPNFNTKFRLIGPWARPDLAMPILTGELYRVVRRTGGWYCKLKELLVAGKHRRS